MKKMYVFVMLLIGVFALSACGIPFMKSDYETYSVIEKKNYKKYEKESDNLDTMAKFDPTLVEYKVKTVNKDKKMVFMALGPEYENAKVKVKDVKDEKGTTRIILQIEKDKGKEKNPILFVEIEKTRELIQIMNEDRDVIGQIRENK